MKTKSIFLSVLIAMSITAKSQTYVTIPNAHFVTWLQNNYPTCMSGNQMNTSCAGILNTTTISFTYDTISDLSGIEHFTNLQSLTCTGIQLTNLPALPNSLTYLNCGVNYQLSSLQALPSGLTELYCQTCNISNLPTLPNSLTVLDCEGNHLTSLPTLPNTITTLTCDNNQLTTLPTLPNGLSILDCSTNLINCFPVFPNSLIYPGSPYFDISSNPFTCLPNYVSAMDAQTLAYPLCVNGDMVNNPHGCNSTVAINENKLNSSLAVFPNPGNGSYNVNLTGEPNNSQLNIEVYNIIGEVVFKGDKPVSISPEGLKWFVDLNSQPNGIYFVRILGAKHIVNQKLVKQ